VKAREHCVQDQKIDNWNYVVKVYVISIYAPQTSGVGVNGGQ
jgi:hypothetical protein